uniref:Putative secreted protein n=1 Tax=Anopheles darlingi TaxID=43151 RepID=A0A2M4DGQ3_ANODA
MMTLVGLMVIVTAPLDPPSTGRGIELRPATIVASCIPYRQWAAVRMKRSDRIDPPHSVSEPSPKLSKMATR